MEFLFRHRAPRPIQSDVMREVYSAVSSGQHLLLHAPTGIGKTDAVLSPALTYALDAGKTVVFLSPKISQHQMALDVARGIMGKHGVHFRVVEVVGRQYLCIHPFARKLRGDEFYELCKRLRDAEACPHYSKYYRSSSFPWSYVGGNVADHETAMDVGLSQEICPYELLSDLLPDADLVIGDYFHVFSPRVGKVFLKKLGKSLEDIVLLVDEAHNLPERVRSVMSVSTSLSAIRNAADEVRHFDAELAEDLLSAAEELESRASTLAAGVAVEISAVDLHEIFPFSFEDAAEGLRAAGQEFLEYTGKRKSYALRLARFLELWDQEGPFLRYIRLTDRGNVFVTMRALDPGSLAGKIFDDVHASVLFSGTLHPLEMYRDLLGIPVERARMRSYPSPFPPENRLVLAVPTVTTRYSRRGSTEFQRIGDLVSRTILAVPGNVAVFFPSYDLLNAIQSYVEIPGRLLLVQQPNMTPSSVSSLLERFRANRGKAVLFAVAGGSLAEGVDYPGDDLLVAIIVGIPLAEMDLERRALIDYYEKKFRRGWLYGYIYPAITRVLQAAGRVIRSERDRGAIVLLDERYTWQNYKKAFPPDFRPKVVSDPAPVLRDFFSQ